MKKLIFIMLVSFVTTSAFSQNLYLNQVYDYDSTNDWGYDVFTEQDGNYRIIGGGHDISKGKWRLISKKIAPDGTELENKALLKSDVYSYYEGDPGAIKKLPSGGYIVPVTAVRPKFSSYVKLAGLAKLDANGDTVWVRYYTDTAQYNEFVNSCNLMPDGGFLLGGQREFSNANRALLIRTDSSGNVLWTTVHLLGTSFVTVEYIGEGLILAGSALTTYITIPPSFNYYRNKPWFMIFDTLGNITYDTLYTSNKYGGGGRVYKDKNGGYFHWGALDSMLTSNYLDAQNFPEYIAHIDDSFRIIWLKNFADMNGKKYIWGVKQLSDSNYLIVGNYNGKGWAMKLDKHGNTIWDNYYFIDSIFTPTYVSYLVDAAERPDGSIVMTGNARSSANPAWQRWDVWVLVVDSMGCMIPNCAPTSVSEPEPNRSRVSVYPNPALGEFFLRNEDPGTIILSNTAGQTLFKKLLTEGVHEIRIPPQASPGLYILQFSTIEGKTEYIKLIYQP